MVRIVCRSLDELREALEKFSVEARAAAEEELNNSADRIVENAEIFCPVDTGAIQESIRKERLGPLRIMIAAGNFGVINPKTGREVDYAEIVHEGSHLVPARPFLYEAIIFEEPLVAQKIVDATIRRIS